MSIPYEEVPSIVNVTYLRSYDLLIEFDNGEKRVLDVSDSFNIPMALQYAPMSEFKKFSFDKNEIWWGDLNSPECMEIGHDSAYNLSMPKSAFISSMILSMGRKIPEPPNVTAYVNWFNQQADAMSDEEALQICISGMDAKMI